MKHWSFVKTFAIPVNMPLRAGTGPVLGRCCQHWTSTGPVLAPTGMLTGMFPSALF